MKRSRLNALVAATTLLLPTAGLAQRPTNRDASETTELVEGGYPIKTGLRFVEAREATLRDDDLVLGVVLGGEARAYPINLMWRAENEILNDKLGGTAITATWCPIAHSGAVYERTVDGRELELGAIGLQDGVAILYDRQTRTAWSQIVGRAVEGPLAGEVLRKRPSTVTTWGRWRALHPSTTVYVDPKLPEVRRFTEESVNRITLAGEGPTVNSDLVVGVEGTRSARAYLLRRLAGLRVANDVIDGQPVVAFLTQDLVTARVLRRSVGEKWLTFQAEGDRMRDEETGSLWDPMTGEALSGQLEGERLEGVVHTLALWYAWKSQRPDTTLWGEPY
jgi:hypothetical protein